jgi:hypothetical protein
MKWVSTSGEGRGTRDKHLFPILKSTPLFNDWDWGPLIHSILEVNGIDIFWISCNAVGTYSRENATLPTKDSPRRNSKSIRATSTRHTPDSPIRSSIHRTQSCTLMTRGVEATQRSLLGSSCGVCAAGRGWMGSEISLLQCEKLIRGWRMCT